MWSSLRNVSPCKQPFERGEKNLQPTINREIIKVWWNYSIEYHLTVRVNISLFTEYPERGRSWTHSPVKKHTCNIMLFLFKNKTKSSIKKNKNSISKALFWVEKNTISKDRILYDFIYVTASKWQNYKDEKRLVVGRS